MITRYSLQVLHDAMRLILIAALLSSSVTWADESTDLNALQQTVDQLERELRATQEAMRVIQQTQQQSSRSPLSGSGRVEPLTSRLFPSSLNTQRPMLGVVLSPASDAKGIRLAAVTADGPADQAGLQVGDRLTAINGTPLTSLTGISTLFETMAQSESGDQCELDFVRDNEPMNTLVTLTLMTPSVGLLDGKIRPLVYRPETDSFASGFNVVPDESLKQLEGLLSRFEPMNIDVLRSSGGRGSPFPDTFRFVRPVTGLELKALNEGLAAYFHTTDGVLVLSSERNQSPLKAGDVVMTVDGEPVSTPYQLLERLSRTDAGETVKLTLMRHAQPMTILIDRLSLGNREASVYSWPFSTESEPDNKESK